MNAPTGDNHSASENLEIVICPTIDSLVSKFVSGELDAALVPTNIALVLDAKTPGGVRLAGATTVGAIGVVGSTKIQSVAQLKGHKIYMSGRGATPEVVLTLLLESLGLRLCDLDIQWVPEPSEAITMLLKGPLGFAVLPQPFIEIALQKIPQSVEALDLIDEWRAIFGEGGFPTSVLVVSGKFPLSDCNALAQAVLSSSLWTLDHLDEASRIVGKLGFIDTSLARLAIPKCGIVSASGEVAKSMVRSYLLLIDNSVALPQKFHFSPSEVFYSTF